MDIDQSAKYRAVIERRLREPYPLWVKMAGGLILKAFFPGTVAQDWEMFISLCSAYLHGGTENLNVQLQSSPARHGGRCVGQILCVVQVGEKHLETVSDAAFEKYSPQMKDYFKERLPVLRKLLAEVVSGACNWERDDAREFFRGFSEALNRKRKNPDNPVEDGEATKIYILLLMNWCVGRDFHTATELHQELCRLWGNNHPYLSDVKTIQKLCGRIRYPTCPPGRPRKLPRH